MNTNIRILTSICFLLGSLVTPSITSAGTTNMGWGRIVSWYDGDYTPPENYRVRYKDTRRDGMCVYAQTDVYRYKLDGTVVNSVVTHPRNCTNRYYRADRYRLTGSHFGSRRICRTGRFSCSSWKQ